MHKLRLRPGTIGGGASPWAPLDWVTDCYSAVTRMTPISRIVPALTSKCPKNIWNIIKLYYMKLDNSQMKRARDQQAGPPRTWAHLPDRRRWQAVVSVSSLMSFNAHSECHRKRHPLPNAAHWQDRRLRRIMRYFRSNEGRLAATWQMARAKVMPETPFSARTTSQLCMQYIQGWSGHGPQVRNKNYYPCQASVLVPRDESTRIYNDWRMSSSALADRGTILHSNSFGGLTCRESVFRLTNTQEGGEAHLIKPLVFDFSGIISAFSLVTFEIWKTDSVIAIASQTVVSVN